MGCSTVAQLEERYREEHLALLRKFVPHKGIKIGTRWNGIQYRWMFRGRYKSLQGRSARVLYAIMYKDCNGIFGG